MGVTISKTSDLSPISFVSTIFGFIGFAITIATFLRVTWENIQTFLGAATQISDLLGNLKQGLYEERAHLRKVRRWQRRRGSFQGGPRSGPDADKHEKWFGHGYLDMKDMHDDDQSTRVLREAIRNMIRDFRYLEQPFLRDDVESRYRDPHVRNGEGYAPSDDEEYYKTEYRTTGIRERWLWLNRKGSVVDMMAQLSRLETRRIAKEVGEACLIVRGMERDFQVMDDRIWNLEQRMTRVVGVRRVDHPAH
ncbi:hypothetical protein MPH_04292 [Macrophomina phaseolina MS6]|uniref:Uncharacterized protein n=2 Tax=Macrophomina phaseolina TaxID=35725 RepID=K2SP04_MACPH|nr:hypothetical protein MPH_04292 [Macrophomina phaseolina MS6]KAH7065518.1 hypothetical protein B0J12DRAFT_561304 [Macrophomina phaseolina]